MQPVFLVIAVLTLISAIGCGSGDGGGRRSVEGSVSYGGQAVDEGQIVFEPTEAGPAMAIGQIREGVYRIEAKHGPEPGNYRVRIEGYREKHHPGLAPPPYLGEERKAGVVREQFLPAHYNSSTTLIAEITEDGDGVHDFELSAKR